MKISGERFYLWRAIDHEGAVLESYVSKRSTENVTEIALSAWLST